MSQAPEALRRHRRFRIDVANDSGTQRIRDMSLGGMRVQSTRSLRLDESIEINLAGPLGAVSVRARVVRGRCTGLEELPYEYGFVFVDLDASAQKRVQAFLEARGAEEERATALEPIQLESLRDRIGELERELTSAREKATLLEEAASQPGAAPPSTSSRSTVPPTHFDRNRFTRLVEAGQPLIALVDKPGTQVSGRLLWALAEAMTGTFDLQVLERRFENGTTRESLVNALFTFYQRDLIDFA